MTDLFANHRAAWSFDWRLQAERNAASIAATCQAYGITVLQQECLYGLRWQGAIDGLSPASESDVADLRDALAARGVALVPVFVPRGLQGEAEAHAAVARLCGACVVDMESDSSGDYWPWERASLVRVYARALREACGPDVQIGWQPDGRLADANRMVEWQQLVTTVEQFVDAFYPQLYAGWPAYGLGTAAVTADVARFERFAGLGKPVYPTLYTAESLAEPAALWGQVMDQSTGFCAFRLGATNRQGLEMVRDLALPAPPVPEPEPAPEPVPDRDPRDVLIDEAIQWTDDDAAGAALRRDRIRALVGR